MKIKLSKSDWENIGRKMGWMKTAQIRGTEKMAGLGDIANEIIEKGKDILGGRSKVFYASTLNPYMPVLKFEGKYIRPMEYKVQVTVRKFVPSSPDESDYSISVVEAPNPNMKGILSPTKASFNDVSMLDDQLQDWIEKNEDTAHGWLAVLIKKEMGWLKTAQIRGTDIVGYVYDADHHSPEEALEDLKNGVITATNPNARLDEHGIPESGVEDSEGNKIHPVFASDEGASQFDEDYSDDSGNPTELKYSLITAEGMQAAQGNFEASGWRGMGSMLSSMLKGRSCGPDGPVYEVSEDPEEWKDEKPMSYTFDAINEDGVTCGFVMVKRVDGMPLSW